MSVKIGEKYKVFIESSSGHIIELTDNITIEYTVSHPVEGIMEYEIVMRGYGDHKKTVSKWREENTRDLKEGEWKCLYCGRPNQKIDEICKSCSAVRSFIYE